jgi:hypothetical protein
MTAIPEILSPVGGFGWLLTLNAGTPRDLNLTGVEQCTNSTLKLSIAYPPGTNVTVTATAGGCWPRAGQYSCQEAYCVAECWPPTAPAPAWGTHTT